MNNLDVPEEITEYHNPNTHVGMKFALPVLGGLLLLVGLTAGALFYQTSGPQTTRSSAHTNDPRPLPPNPCGTACDLDHCHCLGGQDCNQGFECVSDTWIQNVCTSDGRSWCQNSNPGPGMTCCVAGYVCGSGQDGGCVWGGGGGGGGGGSNPTSTPIPPTRTLTPSRTPTRTLTPTITRTPTPSIAVCVNRPVDIVLSLDRSSSMTSSKLNAEKNAAKAFVNVFNAQDNTIRSYVRIGAVSWDGNWNRVTSIAPTNNYSSVTSFINSISTISTDVHTCIECGIRKAAALMTDAARRRIVVIMSDGISNRIVSSCNSSGVCSDPTPPACNPQFSSTVALHCPRADSDAVAAANTYKQNGMIFHVVGYGSRVNPLSILESTLTGIGGSNYIYGGDSTNWTRVFTDVASEICGDLRPTPSPTRTPTRVPTRTPTRGPSPTRTRTPTRGPTRTPTRTPTRGPSPTRAPTRTPTPGGGL